MCEYTTGDVDIKVKITSEKNVTIDEIVREATQIWLKAKAKNIPSGDIDAAEALMSEFRKSNPEFCKSYPIVLRYICQMKEYDPRALRKYLIKIKEHPWKTEEEYLDSQADYVVILYQAKHKHWNRTDISRLRKNVRDMLQYEHEAFKHHVEEFDREVSSLEYVHKEKNSHELTEFVRIAAKTIESRGGTVRVETDLRGGDIDIPVAGVDVKPIDITADDLLG